MKWFEKVVGKEKIIHLFDGDLDLNNVFLDTVLCYDIGIKSKSSIYRFLRIEGIEPTRKPHICNGGNRLFPAVSEWR